jgi:hypothetical protein
MELFNSFVDQWLESIPSDQKLELDVTHETLEYEKSISIILDRINMRPWR